jgi:hypothetical protein
LGGDASGDICPTTFLAFPFKKAGNQLVFVRIAAWVSSEAVATPTKNSGIPTVGFTTNHIFP